MTKKFENKENKKYLLNTKTSLTPSLNRKLKIN